MARQRFGDGDDSDTEAHQEHLRQARPRVGATVQAWDQAGHGNVQKSRCRQGQGIRQRLLSLIEPEIGDDAAEYRRQPRRHVQEHGPLPRHTGMQQQRKIADAMRDLVSCHGERGHQPERHTRQKRRGDENAIQRVMNAVPNENQHPRRPIVVMAVSAAVAMPMRVEPADARPNRRAIAMRAVMAGRVKAASLRARWRMNAVTMRITVIADRHVSFLAMVVRMTALVARMPPIAAFMDVPVLAGRAGVPMIVVIAGVAVAMQLRHGGVAMATDGASKRHRCTRRRRWRWRASVSGYCGSCSGCCGGSWGRRGEFLGLILVGKNW